MFALEYFNSDVFIWNFCLNVFEAFTLLKFFLQVTMNIGKIKSCQSIFTPPPLPYKLNIVSISTFIMGPDQYTLILAKKNPNIL